jgi:hypothetical protein
MVACGLKFFYKMARVKEIANEEEIAWLPQFKINQAKASFAP